MDSTWTSLAVERSEAEISLGDLSEKSLDARFYDRIIDFALRNQLVLADRTKGDLEASVRENWPQLRKHIGLIIGRIDLRIMNRKAEICHQNLHLS